MSTATVAKMTIAEFLALPDDGKERWLINGQLHEEGEVGMTYRNRFHTRVEAAIARLLGNWAKQRPEPRGEVHSGEVGCILRPDADTLVGIDVAYFSAETMARQTEDTTLIDGPPVLAVEVLSPSDSTEDIRDKVLEYLAAGVELVWIVDPYFHTVTVHRPHMRPEMFNVDDTLTGGDAMPGFSVAVADLFC